MVRIYLNADFMKLWLESIEHDCAVGVAWFCYVYRVGSWDVMLKKKNGSLCTVVMPLESGWTWMDYAC